MRGPVLAPTISRVKVRQMRRRVMSIELPLQSIYRTKNVNFITPNVIMSLIGATVV
jgi:hypothetical protein